MPALFSAARLRGGLPAILAIALSIPALAVSDPGAVYTMTNAASANSVLAYHRSGNGSLSPAGSFLTGGQGTDAGLGSQGAIALSGRWLLAVNAGSNDITVFRIGEHGLVWKSKTPSGGTMPVSIAVNGDWVFVVNAGGAPNISGFRLREDGSLAPLAGSTIGLAGSAPAQISFDNTGEFLVVTEKNSNSIAVFRFDEGSVSGPIEQASHGAVPFGFTFDKRDHLLVTEAGGAPNGSSAVSSYDLADNGNLELISGSVDATQSSACWIVVTRNGRYAYTANTHPGTISEYHVAPDGKLTLGMAIAANNGANSLPGDLALSHNSQYLYSLNPGLGSVLVFRINADGSLTPAGSVAGVPVSAAGLVAR